jgi:large subunit ribosomal protein L5
MADRKGQQQGGQGGQNRGSQQGARSGQQQGGRSAQQAQARGADRGRRDLDLPPPPTGPRPTPRLRTRYDEEVRPALMTEFGYANPMQAPKVEKVTLNIGMGEALNNAQAMDNAVSDLETITGQKVVVTKAKKSIASFKVREGNAIGCMVTLRGARMYDFLDKLFSIALPRVRDFSGVNPDAFDGRGNYNLGLREQIIFPEIEYDRVDRVRGMEVAIVTSARTDQEGRRLLQLMGMPFQRPGEQRRPMEEPGARRRRPAGAGARGR